MSTTDLLGLDLNGTALNLVAIETATETVAVAVRTATGLEAELALTGRRRHVESLTPALAHLLDQVGLVPADLHAVTVDLGPGLFTGLRVGVSAAKALAQGLGIGVVGLSSLEILLQAAAESGRRGLVLAAVDARRGEVFASLAEVDQTGSVRPLDPPWLGRPDDLAARLAALGGTEVLAVGDGAVRYADVLEATSGVRCLRAALRWPPPPVLLTMAAARLAAGETPAPPAGVVPLYMRDADARVNFAQVAKA